MAYEKKIEPLQRWEVIMSAITLQLFIIFYLVLPWTSMSEECFDAVYESSVASDEDMMLFHDCMVEHRDGFLGGCACLLLGFPAIIAHLFYFNRLGETIMSFLNFGLSNWLYTASWGIAGTILCTLIPSLGIFLAYYDWEFTTDDGSGNDFTYIGYAMQFQFFHFWLILWDCCAIPIGIAASVPWFRGVGVLCGCCKSSHYSLSQDGREKMLGMALSIKYGRLVLAVLMTIVGLICLFGGFGDSLDFAKDGFWSYNGGSQFLSVMIALAIEIQCLAYFRAACKFDDNTKFLNENVESMASQDAAQQ